MSGLSAGREEVRSLSVPALGVTAMRLGGGGEGDGRREGERGFLARRPPRDPHVPHRPPLRLELTGTRVGGDEGNTRSVAAAVSVCVLITLSILLTAVQSNCVRTVVSDS